MREKIVIVLTVLLLCSYWSNSWAKSSELLRTFLPAVLGAAYQKNQVAEIYELIYRAKAGGAIIGKNLQNVTQGNDGRAVTAKPDPGYFFVSWSDGSTANPRKDTEVTSDINVTAKFTIKKYTLTYNAGADGAIQGARPQTVAHGKDGTPVTAVPHSGYHFVSWSDNSTVNPRTDTNVTSNIRVTAIFTASEFTLTYNAGVGGSINGQTPQTVTGGGDGTGVTAVSDSGYIFLNWSDGSTDNPRADTNVTSNINVNANFGHILTYNAGQNGSITGSTPQAVTHGGNGTSVTAVPNVGYVFWSWSDGSINNPRTDTNVTSNISVTANFVFMIL